MTGARVELAEIALPEFGLPGVEPDIPAATFEARIASALQRAADAGYDALIVYADREHFANMAYLTGFDPRFEEALLILTPRGAPTLLVGNEDMAYTAISPLRLQVVLYQTFSLLSQPRSSSPPLARALRDAGIGATRGQRIGLAVGSTLFPPKPRRPMSGWKSPPTSSIRCAVWAATRVMPGRFSWSLNMACAPSTMSINWPPLNSRPRTARRACATCCSTSAPA